MRAIIVNGMAFGDEGKGLATDFFVDKYNSELVIRYNGGAQAAHNVVLPGGRHHTFSSFGSGTLRLAHTHLSRFTLVSLFALVDEYEHLVRKGYRPIISIDPKCVIVTPYHLIANQIVENRRNDDRHGSVGVGIGEARKDELSGLALRIEDFYTSSNSPIDILSLIYQRKCNEIQGFDSVATIDRYGPTKLCESMSEILNHLSDVGALTIRDTQDVLADARGVVVFEGAQGVLLDETLGTAPHNSWTNCTFQNAEAILKEASITDYEKCGIFRTYFTRHGAGPFPTEDNNMVMPENHNKTHDFMGRFRVGHFDLVATAYACDVSRPDYLFITHCDKPTPGDQMLAVAYRYNDNSISNSFDINRLASARPVYEPASGLRNELERETALHVRFTSYGPTSNNVRSVFS